MGIDEYYECFRYYDRDGDQKLDAQEVVTCLRALGINMSQREMREVPEQIGDGKVDWHRFLAIIAPKGNRKTTQDDIRQAFNVFDKELIHRADRQRAGSSARSRRGA